MELSNRKITDIPETVQGSSQWHDAKVRAMLYLTALQIPPDQTLLYAYRAMQKARLRGVHRDAVSVTLECLRGILISEGILNSENSVQTRCIINFRNKTTGSWPPGDSLRSIAFAPIKRSCMPAAKLELQPWRRPSILLWRAALRWLIESLNTQYSYMAVLFLQLIYVISGI
jgi:hypothetical protein